MRQPTDSPPSIADALNPTTPSQAATKLTY